MNFETIAKQWLMEHEHYEYEPSFKDDVDNCDKIIGIWDGSKGGTGNCIKYAESVGKDIYYINPRT